jgi:hypothetical protein
MGSESNKKYILVKTFTFLSFITAGLYSWAIRGSAGYGATMGCLFAGILWGILWYWFSNLLSINDGNTTLRYNRAWAIPALFLGIGLSGMQGWMQWPNWVNGKFYLNWQTQTFIHINPALGYMWWFIVALHWGGMGAIALAWTSPNKPLKWYDWSIRLGMGAIGISLVYFFFTFIPTLFLPFYNSLNGYDITLYPQLVRVINDNKQAILWFGAWLGFLVYEIVRKDWNNVGLILIVSIVTGILWMVCQFIFWVWLPNRVFPEVFFNWWRVWESAAGGAIGIAYGLGFILFNKPKKINKENQNPTRTQIKIEYLIGGYLTIWIGILWGMKNGFDGLNVIYDFLGNQVDWTYVFIPVIVIGGVLFSYFYLKRARIYTSDLSTPFLPKFDILLVVSYILHRLSMVFSDGPLTNSIERAFFYYYAVLALMDFIMIGIVQFRFRKSFIRLKMEKIEPL